MEGLSITTPDTLSGHAADFEEASSNIEQHLNTVDASVQIRVIKYPSKPQPTEEIKAQIPGHFPRLNEKVIANMQRHVDVCARYIAGPLYTDNLDRNEGARNAWEKKASNLFPNLDNFFKANQLHANKITAIVMQTQEMCEQLLDCGELDPTTDARVHKLFNLCGDTLDNICRQHEERDISSDGYGSLHLQEKLQVVDTTTAIACEFLAIVSRNNI